MVRRQRIKSPGQTVKDADKMIETFRIAPPEIHKIYMEMRDALARIARQRARRIRELRRELEDIESESRSPFYCNHRLFSTEQVR